MLEGLDDVPWGDLEHAIGSAEDVPDLLRRLLDPDRKGRQQVLQALYNNVFHQGSRFPAAPYVVPFLIEMCADPSVPGRGDLLVYWGSLIAGYFSVRERPTWGDGERVHGWDEIDQGDPAAEAVHGVYRESLRGIGVPIDRLDDTEPAVRVGAAWVLACLPTRADETTPHLESRLAVEPSEWVRAAIAFALGELGRADPLRRILAEDPSQVTRCMAACELARIEPDGSLIGPLLEFLAAPIEGYEGIPGAGGPSTGDAAFSISLLPIEARRRAVPAICDRLDRARSFDVVPFVIALLSAAFPERREPIDGSELDPLQREILGRMVDNEELWSLGNLFGTFPAHGLPNDRRRCADLLGVRVADDPALKELRAGLGYADMGCFWDTAREHILRAMERDPSVVERSPAPAEAWLLCARVFAETDPERALAAYRNACAIDPASARRVRPEWHLADLIGEDGPA